MDPFETPGAFSWCELLTHNPDAAVAFYAALFGWHFETEVMPDGPYHVAKIGGRAIGGVMKMPDHLAATGTPPAWSCYVTVADVDAKAAQVTALGGKVVHGPVDIPGVGRLAVIVDPQGAVLNVIRYAMPAA